MDIPRFDNPSQKKEKERRGVGIVGAGGAPAASPVGAGFSTAAPGGAASSWSSLITSAAKTLGISTVAATKGGIVALTLLAGTIAAGISLVVGEYSPGGRPRLGHRVFDKNTASPEASDAFAPSGEDPSSGQGSSALDYLRQANTSPAAEASVEDGAVADSPGPGAKDAEVKQWAEAVKSNPKAKSKEAKTPAPKPVMKPGSGKIELKASSMQTSLQLSAMTDFSGGVAGQFQDVYKPKAFATPKPSYGPNRRIPLTGTQNGSSAWDQAKFTGGMSRKAARMGTGPGSAAAAGLPFDGGMSLGQTSRPSGYGALGGTSDKIGASSDMDIKNVSGEEPPKPNDVKKTKNETPYQGMIYAAIAALMMGQVLVAVAGQLVGQAQKAPGPQSASLLAMAKATAAAAMAAGGTAAGLGGAIAGEYDQVTQGLPFMIGGAVIAMQAGMVLIKAEKAGQDASQGVNNAGQAASDTSNSNLQPPQIPGMPGNNGDKGSDDQPKQKEHVKPAGRTYIDQPTGGNVNPPGEDAPSSTIGL